MLRQLISLRHYCCSLRFKRGRDPSNVRLVSSSQLPAAGNAEQGTTRVVEVGGGRVTLEHLGPGIGKLPAVTSSAEPLKAMHETRILRSSSILL